MRNFEQRMKEQRANERRANERKRKFPTLLPPDRLCGGGPWGCPPKALRTHAAGSGSRGKCHHQMQTTTAQIYVTRTCCKGTQAELGRSWLPGDSPQWQHCAGNKVLRTEGEKYGLTIATFNLLNWFDPTDDLSDIQSSADSCLSGGRLVSLRLTAAAYGNIAATLSRR